MGERIGAVRVAAELRHQDVRREVANASRDRLAERCEPCVVVGFGMQRDVHLRPLGLAGAGLVLEPGSGKEVAAGLVDGDGEDARFRVEDRLRAVAVMDVDVDVGDALHALGEQPRDRDRGIVVDAESRRPRRHRVVQSSCRIERVIGAAGQHLVRCDDARACHERRGLVHPREDRVVARAVAVPSPVAVFAVARAFRRVDVVGRMDELQFLVGCAPASERGDVVPRRDPEGLDQVEREQEPLGFQRMLRPMVVDIRLPAGDERNGPAHSASSAITSRSTSSAISASVIVNGGPSMTRSPSTPSAQPVLG